MSTTDLRGRIAVVTGARGGIGRAVVEALVAKGAEVIGLDRVPFDPGSFGVSPVPFPAMEMRPLDVRDGAAVEEMFGAIERERGPIDIGVNVAGVLSNTLIVDTSEAAWNDVFAVNALGVFNVGRTLGQLMTPRRRGSIVTVGSNAASVPRHGMAAYSASKAAAAMFTRCLGLELGPFGIRCNVVSPGSTRTPMLEQLWSAVGSEDATLAGSLPAFRTGIPLGRIADAADVAAAVVFLASDDARHITMADLRVDGGASLGN